VPHWNPADDATTIVILSAAKDLSRLSLRLCFSAVNASVFLRFFPAFPLWPLCQNFDLNATRPETIRLPASLLKEKEPPCFY